MDERTLFICLGALLALACALGLPALVHAVRFMRAHRVLGSLQWWLFIALDNNGRKHKKQHMNHDDVNG